MNALSTCPLFIILLWLLAGLSPAQANITLEPKDSAQVAAQYGLVPMSFEANRGQTDPAVRFLSRGAGYALYITPTEAVFSLRKAGMKPDAGADASHRGVGYAAHTLTPASGVTETSEKARAARPTPQQTPVHAMPPSAQTPVGRAVRAKPEAPTNTPDEALAVHMQLVGANPNADVAGLDELPGKVNYLRGNDPKRWQTGVATYGKVKLNSVYDGVDLVYYGNGRQLEYDFIVAPGADPNAIRLNFSGTDNARLDAAGDLLLHTQDGELRLQKPVVYQTIGGRRQNVDGRFVLHDVAVGEGQGEGKSRQIGFQVAAYDAGLPLVIDPVLVYSSYLGGSGWDWATGIAVDNAGHAYVTGYTDSSDFPSVNAKYPQFRGSSDAFVIKLSADGQHLIYSTYLGGNDDNICCQEVGYGIAVDSIGNAYVTGQTDSPDFPITANALYPHLLGSTDAFITKLSADGQRLLYSTYLGGSYSDSANAIALDSIGNAYVTGQTESFDFPTVNAKYTNIGGYYDTFVTKFNANGTQVLYSTYLGGSGVEVGNGIAVDNSSNIYVVGWTVSTDFSVVNAKYPQLRGDYDAFITKFNASGQAVIYSTYLGGSQYESSSSVAVDGIGNAYVTGITKSADFPIVKAKYPQLRGQYDAFITKFNASGQAVIYSSYLGGSDGESGESIATDSMGNVYVTGSTWSSDFPIANAPYPQYPGKGDAFVSKLSVDGQRLVYSSYLGGSSFTLDAVIGPKYGSSIASDSLGNAYVTGFTNKSDFPTSATDTNIVSYDPTYNGGGGDAFVAKFSAPYLEIAPSNQDFGLATPGAVIDRAFTVKNTANRTLTGTLATTAPFSIVSGASFTLAEGASKNITVRFAPTQKGFFKAALKAAGNFPATSVQLQGIAALAVNHVPVIGAAVLQGAPGNASVVSGRYFGPLPGELRIDGSPVAATEWNDTFIRYTIPDLSPGKHTLTVSTAFGEASTPLQVLSAQPLISTLLPGNGAVGSTVVIDGYNFGAQQSSSTITVGGIDAPVLFWSDQRLRIKIPALPTGIRYPVQITTATGLAEKTLLVRKLLLVTQYGDCDTGVLATCPPVILSIDKQSADGKSADIVLENLYNRWYELTVTPSLATIPNALPRFIGPKQKIKISNVAIEPGANIGFFADATSNHGMTAVAFDMLHMVAMGGHLSVTDMDLALDEFSLLAPDAKLVVFFAKLVDNLNNKDIGAIIKQIVELPKLASDPAVQFFLIGSLKLSATQLDKLASWGQVVHVASVVTDMVEQLLLPRYAASSLTAQ